MSQSRLRFKIHRFKEIDSTNSAAMRHAQEGAPAGAVFVADYQSKGHGKWGRSWSSPRGKNLLFSILLRPLIKAVRAAGVTQVACRSVARVLERKYRLRTSFKRPNDVLVGGKKICGVLVEAQGRANGDLDSMVVGVGLNVNAAPRGIIPSATSIRAETGKSHSRRNLLKVLLTQLKRDLKCFL